MRIIRAILSRLKITQSVKALDLLLDLNEPGLNYINSEEHRSRKLSVLDDITLHDIEDINEAKKLYQKNGIVVIPNFISRDLCLELRTEIDNLVNSSFDRSINPIVSGAEKKRKPRSISHP